MGLGGMGWGEKLGREEGAFASCVAVTCHGECTPQQAVCFLQNGLQP